MKFYPWLAGAWAGVLWFFTFGVARLLFAIFPRERAGEVTVALFPAYFAAAITLGLLATIALWRLRRSARDIIALVLQILALAALASVPTLIQPAMAGHAAGSPEFLRWHGISMALNLFSLLAVPAASLLVLAKRKE